MEQTTHFGFETIKAHLKTHRVKEVFNSVSKRYDLMNDVMSFGLHRLWKRLCLAQTQVQPHHHVLDLAGGTGDLSLLSKKKLNETGSLTVADINGDMLCLAKEKLINQGFVQGISYVQTNAEHLPFPDQHFDRIMMAFGLRNVTYQEQALREMLRVLKPGGRVVILEFSQFKNEKLNPLYESYSFKILPWLGKHLAKDENSYRYLAESIRKHPNQEALKQKMLEVGFEEVTYQDIHQGLVAIHIGLKF